MPNPDRRPIPVKVFNVLSDMLNTGSGLDMDKLIQKARKRTGLSDLGDDFRDDALGVLLKSIREEARLHPFGQLMIREKIKSQLENRLWAQHWFTIHPEILDIELLPIILITGPQRTGTTKLQRLLSLGNGARPLWCWEALFPAPIGEKQEKKKRQSLTRRNERAVKWLSPTFHNIHPIYFDRPEEDVLLIDLQFMSTSSEAIMHVPSYAAWLDEQDQRAGYTYEKKLLQLLQWQNGGEYWVLKSPHHLEYLTEFKSIFPESHILWTHRKIEESIPSFMSMLFHSRRMFSNEVNTDLIKNHWIPKIGRMIERGMSFRHSDQGNIIDIRFNELIKNEIGTLNKIAVNTPFKVKAGSDHPNAGNHEKYLSKHAYNYSAYAFELESFKNQHKSYINLIEGEKSQTK